MSLLCKTVAGKSNVINYKNGTPQPFPAGHRRILSVLPAPLCKFTRNVRSADILWLFEELSQGPDYKSRNLEEKQVLWVM